ncbi:MAG: hypothetical protein R2827_02485 [Bdellovibrionales bacterium]
MKNIGAVLHKAGLDYSNVVKAGIFLTDMRILVLLMKCMQSILPEIRRALLCSR